MLNFSSLGFVHINNCWPSLHLLFFSCWFKCFIFSYVLLLLNIKDLFVVQHYNNFSDRSWLLGTWVCCSVEDGETILILALLYSSICVPWCHFHYYLFYTLIKITLSCSLMLLLMLSCFSLYLAPWCIQLILVSCILKVF